MIMTSALELPARRPVCLHGTSADVMAITKWSIALAPKPRGSHRSPAARRGCSPCFLTADEVME